jgi:cytochrome b561
MLFRNTPDRYGAVTKALHWTIALLIICLVCVGIYMADFAEVKQKFVLVPLHKEFGICVLILASCRVLWHLYSRTPGFVASLKKWEIWGARLAHYYLYFAMFTMPLSGWIFSSAAGRTVKFFGVDLPNLVHEDKGIKELFSDVHTVVGYSLIPVVGVHAMAALKHHFFDKDITLSRMLPFGKPDKMEKTK